MQTGHFFPARPNIMWTEQARPKFQNPAWSDGLVWPGGLADWQL